MNAVGWKHTECRTLCIMHQKRSLSLASEGYSQYKGACTQLLSLETELAEMEEAEFLEENLPPPPLGLPRLKGNIRCSQ
jgi:hypothetical protein